MLRQEDIMFAISNTKSNKEAARFLNVSYNTYKKYAKEYIDIETGKSFFDLHLDIDRKSRASGTLTYRKMKLDDILVKDSTETPITDFRLRDMLIQSQYKIDKCDCCGFHTQREIDNKVPLLLVYVDNDQTNKEIDNIRFFCANCYYLFIGDIISGDKI